MHEYNADVISVYDGDTIRIDIDLGFGVWLRNQSIRLLGIDTPEVRGEEKDAGIVARDRLIELLEQNNNKCVIKTHKSVKRGKYGRILVEVFTDPDSKSLNKVLIDEGLADRYMK